MPALNFNKFPNLVASGEKTQTIRRVWKRPIKPGDRLVFYTGLRTKACQKLGEGRCTEVWDIRIVSCMHGITHIISLKNLQVLSPGEQRKLAEDDGFPDTASFEYFFQRTYGLPFKGVVIKWEGE